MSTYCLVITAAVILSTSVTILSAIEINEDRLVDVKGVTGSKAEIVCEAFDTRDTIEKCVWYSPNGERYSARNRRRRISNSRRRIEDEYEDYDDRYDEDDDDQDYRKGDVKVTLDDRRDECTLTINSLRREDSGPWECSVDDGRDEAYKYAMVRVTDKAAPLQLLLDPDDKELDVRRGDDVQIICPTNHNIPGDRPVCKFIDPKGKIYNIIGK